MRHIHRYMNIHADKRSLDAWYRIRQAMKLSSSERELMQCQV